MFLSCRAAAETAAWVAFLALYFMFMQFSWLDRSATFTKVTAGYETSFLHIFAELFEEMIL